MSHVSIRLVPKATVHGDGNGACVALGHPPPQWMLGAGALSGRASRSPTRGLYMQRHRYDTRNALACAIWCRHLLSHWAEAVAPMSLARPHY